MTHQTRLATIPRNSLVGARGFLTSLISSVHCKGANDQNPLHDASLSTKNIFLTLHVLFPNELLAALDLLDRELITRMVPALSVTETLVGPRTSPRSNQALSGDSAPIHNRGDDEAYASQAAEERAEARHLAESASLRDEGSKIQQRLLCHSIYYVRSAQQSRQKAHHAHSRHGGSGSGDGGVTGLPTRNRFTHDEDAPAETQVTSYEVRLDAWSCSCPAFAFAAFPTRPVHSANTADDQDEEVPKHAETADHDGKESSVERETRGSELWRFGGLTRGQNLAACKHLLACVLAEHCGGFSHLVSERTASVEELAGWAAGWSGAW